MPKLKTHKIVSSRFKKTKTKKFLRRRAGQGHFNSRDTGNDTRRKRSDISTKKTEHKTLKSLMPYA